METRRVKLTKKTIKDAFIELMDERSINKITVSDICELADVNRSTFYAYYTDTLSLLNEIENDILMQVPVFHVVTSPNGKAQYHELLAEFFKYVKANKKQFRVLLVKTNSDDFNKRLASAVIKNGLNDVFTKTNELAEYEHVYCINGIISSLKLWIEEDFPVESEEFAELIVKLSSRTIRVEQ